MMLTQSNTGASRKVAWSN